MTPGVVDDHPAAKLMEVQVLRFALKVIGIIVVSGVIAIALFYLLPGVFHARPVY